MHVLIDRYKMSAVFRGLSWKREAQRYNRCLMQETQVLSGGKLQMYVRCKMRTVYEKWSWRSRMHRSGTLLGV